MTDDLGYSHERELGRRIARLREAAGLTQRELARRMDLTQSALSRIESGQRRLSAAQVSQLARILAIDPGALLAQDRQEDDEPVQSRQDDGPVQGRHTTPTSGAESTAQGWSEAGGPPRSAGCSPRSDR